MAHGVEVRLPFLDHRLFEYGSRIPAALLAWEGRIKYPLREAARPYLTSEVYAAPKKTLPGAAVHAAGGQQTL